MEYLKNKRKGLYRNFKVEKTTDDDNHLLSNNLPTNNLPNDDIQTKQQKLKDGREKRVQAYRNLSPLQLLEMKKEHDINKNSKKFIQDPIERKNIDKEFKSIFENIVRDNKLLTGRDTIILSIPANLNHEETSHDTLHPYSVFSRNAEISYSELQKNTNVFSLMEEYRNHMPNYELISKDNLLTRVRQRFHDLMESNYEITKLKKMKWTLYHQQDFIIEGLPDCVEEIRDPENYNVITLQKILFAFDNNDITVSRKPDLLQNFDI